MVPVTPIRCHDIRPPGLMTLRSKPMHLSLAGGCIEDELSRFNWRV